MVEKATSGSSVIQNDTPLFHSATYGLFGISHYIVFQLPGSEKWLAVENRESLPEKAIALCVFAEGEIVDQTELYESVCDPDGKEQQFGVPVRLRRRQGSSINKAYQQSIPTP